MLCGGGANLKGLPQFLSERLKIPVVCGNPWVNILKPPIKSIPELSYQESLTYVTALGLALRDVSYRQ
jgi:Tfp pilus assembly PilM family ATPase